MKTLIMLLIGFLLINPIPTYAYETTLGDTIESLIEKYPEEEEFIIYSRCSGILYMNFMLSRNSAYLHLLTEQMKNYVKKVYPSEFENFSSDGGAQITDEKYKNSFGVILEETSKQYQVYSILHDKGEFPIQDSEFCEKFFIN